MKFVEQLRKPLLYNKRADRLSLGAPPLVDDPDGDRAARLWVIDHL